MSKGTAMKLMHGGAGVQLAFLLALTGCGKEESSTVAPPTGTSGAVAGSDTAPEMPDVTLPDVEIPDIEIPDIEIPDVEIPDVKDIEIPDEARQHVQEYLESLDLLNGALDGVKDRFSAAAATPRITGLINDLKSHWTALEQMNPEATAQLRQAFSAQIDRLEGTFQQQVERIGTELGLGDVASLLEGVPLFGKS